MTLGMRVDHQKSIFYVGKTMPWEWFILVYIYTIYKYDQKSIMQVMPVISLYHDYNHNNVYYDLGIMNYPNIVDYYPKV